MWISEIRLQQLQTCYRGAESEHGPSISIDKILVGKTYIIANIKASKIMALDTISGMLKTYPKQLKEADPSWSKLPDDAIFAEIKTVDVQNNMIGIDIDHPTARQMMTLPKDQEILLSVATTQFPNKVTVHEIPKVGLNERHFLQWRITKLGGKSSYGHEVVKNIDILQYVMDVHLEDDEILTVRYMNKEYERKAGMPPIELMSTVSWGPISKIDDADGVAADALQKISRTDLHQVT